MSHSVCGDADGLARHGLSRAGRSPKNRSNQKHSTLSSHPPHLEADYHRIALSCSRSYSDTTSGLIFARPADSASLGPSSPRPTPFLARLRTGQAYSHLRSSQRINPFTAPNCTSPAVANTFFAPRTRDRRRHCTRQHHKQHFQTPNRK
jgi:hypothetical protein